MGNKDPKAELSDRITEEMLKQMGLGTSFSPLPAVVFEKPSALKERTAKARGSNKLPGGTHRHRRTPRGPNRS